MRTLASWFSSTSYRDKGFIKTRSNAFVIFHNSISTLHVHVLFKMSRQEHSKTFLKMKLVLLLLDKQNFGCKSVLVSIYTYIIKRPQTCFFVQIPRAASWSIVLRDVFGCLRVSIKCVWRSKFNNNDRGLYNWP